MQTIINENFFAIIAVIAVVTLVAMYLVSRMSQNKEDIKPVDTKKTDLKPLEKTIEKIQEVKTVEVEEIKVEKAPEPEKLTVVSKINRKKRELIPHGKITKDDFSLFKNVKILIAEDNIINQKVIAGLLSGSGINITIANDGQEALNILEKDNDFSIILMDAHMPIVDGFQATRIIRKTSSYDHIPVIALSGDTAADDVRNMLNVGMEAHLEKPLKMDALYDILYTYTNGDEGKRSSTSSKDTSLEFDSDKGLEICGGDEDFYLEILNDFMSKYSNSASILQGHINSTDGAKADKILLDISGVAANIGADNLHQIALDLKNSIANPSDLEYINNLKKYKRSLGQVCEAIEKYIAG